MLHIILVRILNCFRIQGSKLLNFQVCIHCLNVSSSFSSCQENWKRHFRKGIILRHVYEMLKVYDGSCRPYKTFQIQMNKVIHLFLTVCSGTSFCHLFSLFIVMSICQLTPGNFWTNWQIFMNLGMNILQLKVTQSVYALTSHLPWKEQHRFHLISMSWIFIFKIKAIFSSNFL